MIIAPRDETGQHSVALPQTAFLLEERPSINHFLFAGPLNGVRKVLDGHGETGPSAELVKMLLQNLQANLCVEDVHLVRHLPAVFAGILKRDEALSLHSRPDALPKKRVGNLNETRISIFLSDTDLLVA